MINVASQLAWPARSNQPGEGAVDSPPTPVGHFGVDGRAVGVIDPAAQPSFDHRRRGGVCVAGLVWVIDKILTGGFDGPADVVARDHVGCALVISSTSGYPEHRPSPPCNDRGVRRQILEG
jgi:hypothetical protein